MSSLQKKSTRNWLPGLKPFYYKMFIDTLLNWSRKIGRTKIFHGSLHWEVEVHTVFATLRLSGERVEMVVRVHCGTVSGDEFAPKCVPQNSPTMLFDNHLDSVSRTTSKCWNSVIPFACTVLKLVLLSNFYYVRYWKIKSSDFSECYNFRGAWYKTSWKSLRKTHFLRLKLTASVKGIAWYKLSH